MSNDFKLVPIGEILKPHGIKGELKILLYNEKSRSLKNNKLVFLGDNENLLEFKIERISFFIKKNRIKLFEINNKEAAESLRGKVVNIYRSNLPDLKEGEYYLNDLIDFTIVDESNNNYGVVNDILHLPANDVLSVFFNNKEYLIPMIKDVIIQVNIDLKCIVINPIKGLF